MSKPTTTKVINQGKRTIHYATDKALAPKQTAVLDTETFNRLKKMFPREIIDLNSSFEDNLSAADKKAAAVLTVPNKAAEADTNEDPSEEVAAADSFAEDGAEDGEEAAEADTNEDPSEEVAAAKPSRRRRR